MSRPAGADLFRQALVRRALVARPTGRRTGVAAQTRSSLVKRYMITTVPMAPAQSRKLVR